MIHVAITRRVRPGSESEFESRLRDFFQLAQDQARSDAYLVRPLSNDEYGILRSFSNETAMRAFYASDLYRKWNESIAELVVGPPALREIHGLEAFFGSSSEHPKKWKMAFLTWMAVNPAVYFSASLVKAAFPRLVGLAELLLVNALVVTALTWLLMPVLTRWARPWLEPREAPVRQPVGSLGAR